MDARPTRSRRGLRGLATALLALTAAGLATAQAPSQLSGEELAERARKAALEVERLEAATKANLETLRTIENDLGQAVALLNEDLPEPPVLLEDLETHDITIIRAEISRAKSFLDAWSQRQVWATRAHEMLAAAEELQGTIRKEHELLFDRVALSRTLFIEAKRRLIRGDLDAARLGLPESTSLESLVRLSGDLLARRKTVLAEVDALLEQLRERSLALGQIEAADPEVERAGKRTALALATIAEATAVEGEFLGRLSELPPESLPTEIERVAREWLTRRTELEQAASVVDGLAATLDELSQARAALRAPTPEDVPAVSDADDVAAARREVELARLLLDYYQADLAAVEGVNAARVELLASMGEATQRHNAFSRQTARVASALRIALELVEAGTLTDWSPPEGVTRLEAWDSWRALQARQSDRVELAQQVEAAIRDTAIADYERRIARERTSLERAEARLKTELSYSEFVSEMEQRPSEDLLAGLAPDGVVATRMAATAEELVELRTAIEEATSRCLATAAVSRALETPYSRSALRVRGDRLEAIRDELDALPAASVPTDQGGALARTPEDDPPGQVYEPLISDGTPIELALTESDRIATQQRFARVLLNFYDEVQESLHQWTNEYEELRSLNERHAELLRQKVRELKLRYAGALELRRRATSGELDAALPEDFETLLDQAPLARANEELRDALNAAEELERRSVYELERLRTLATLQPAVRTRRDMADRRAQLIGNPVSKLTSAMTPIEKLDEVELNRLRFEAADASAETMTFWDLSMKRFTSADVLDRFEQPLNAYHMELANTQRVIEELQDAEASYMEIVQSWRDETEVVEPMLEAVQKTLELRLEDYRASRYAAAIARHPGSRQRVEEAFRQTYGHPLPYRLNYDAQDVGLAAELLFGAEMRLVAERTLAWHLTRFQSKLGAEQEIGWYEEQAARIASLLDVQQSREAQMRERIDDLLATFRKRLQVNAGRGLGIALLVPLLAFVLGRMIKRSGRRFEGEIAGEIGEDEADRRRRVRTIARTTVAAVSVLVWIIALIYVFALLGLDVTPIIASASVVGLAVAFGAQALIKDYFYGFFILIENQFTVGDIVTLGPVTGTVEQISLRITTLRDLKGAVHYIPNGSIGQVSNLTQGWSRVVMEVSVPHDVDPDRACGVVQEVLDELYEDPDWQRRVLERPVVPGVERLTESSIDVRLMIKVRPGRQWDAMREANRRIKQRFAELGITVPFPHRVVHHLQDGTGEAGGPVGLKKLD